MDGGKRSYDRPPTDQIEDRPSVEDPPSVVDPARADRLESDLIPPPQFTLGQTQQVDPTSPAAPSASDETARTRHDGFLMVTNQLDSDLTVPRHFEPVQTQPTVPAAPPGPEPSPPLEAPEDSREHVPTLVHGPTSVAVDAPGSASDPYSPSDESSRHFPGNVTGHEQEPMSRAMKIAYCVVCGVLALSALGVLFVHLHHSDGTDPVRAVPPTTTTTSQPAKKPSTVVLPSRLSPTAEVAADDLVTSWSMNNRLGALAVATPTAATTMFSATYTSGLAISRGCSTSFSPIVCTFGPPGGASPTDPIYEIRVTQAAGGWYVSSVRIEN